MLGLSKVFVCVCVARRAHVSVLQHRSPEVCSRRLHYRTRSLWYSATAFLSYLLILYWWRARMAVLYVGWAGGRSVDGDFGRVMGVWKTHIGCSEGVWWAGHGRAWATSCREGRGLGVSSSPPMTHASWYSEGEKKKEHCLLATWEADSVRHIWWAGIRAGGIRGRYSHGVVTWRASPHPPG